MGFDRGRRGERGGRGRDKRDGFGDENFGGFEERGGFGAPPGGGGGGGCWVTAETFTQSKPAPLPSEATVS